MGPSDSLLAGLPALSGGALTMTDILELPSGSREFFVWALQTGEFGAPEVAARLDMDIAEAVGFIAQLLAKGVIKTAAVSGRFRMQLSSKPTRKAQGIWNDFPL